MENQIVNDPWESSENPQLASPEYWGLCSIDIFYCILEKGVGKVRFDPQIHKIDQRRTAIDIVITPLPEMNSSREATRSMVAESKEWAGIVLPSIKALGISTRELNGKYVHAKFTETGKTYVKTADDGSQETKNSTTITFVKLFADDAACRADWAASGGKPAQADTQYQNGNGAVPPLTSTPENGNGKEKATGLAFLKALVANACRAEKDPEKVREIVAQKISTMPPVAKYYTVDSPETMELIAEKLTA